MPVLNELLHRLAQASRGIYRGGSSQEQVAKWDRPPAVRAWRAWAEAHGAFERDELREASRWLNAAESWEGEPASDVLRGELALLRARILERADEPRRAMPHAQEAWAVWFALARNPLTVLEGDTLPSLLEALTYPERLQLPPQQLFMQWLNDRASANLHHSARQVFAACRGVHDGAPALALTEEWRGWYRTTSKAGRIPVEQLVPFEAKLVRDVANLQDQLGEPQAALDGFLEARALLSSPGVKADPSELRQLDFNIGNQQAKLGQHKPAIAAFEQAAKAFDEFGEEEPAFRARHAALVSRWNLGESPKNLLPTLEGLLRGYERLINEGAGDAVESAAAQNLRQGNRMWLSIASRVLGEGIAHERFLHQVFASREGNTRAHTVWLEAGAREGREQSVIGQISMLLARLRQEPGGLLVLALESGVNELLAVTLVSGHVPLSQRLVVERFSTECVEALEGLIRQRREATMGLASRAVVPSAEPSAAFVAACSALWQALPPQTRQRLDAAGIVYFLPEPGGALDETPLELLHDGQTYLGLRKPIVRTASWPQMARALAPNFVDRLACGRLAVVRGADVPGLGQLAQAEDEVRMVEAAARERFADVQPIVEPTVKAFTQLLAGGLDVLHFTGHSYADHAGEYLMLRSNAMVGVPELGGRRPQPAPVCIFCSCLVGLHRPTRAGLARGIATALLDTGAPAVVAAMVPLPDQVGHDFALALHFHAKSRPLGEAVQAARLTLSRRFHPATWGCFALFGRHDARLTVLADAPLPTWPALLVRCLATRGALWSQELEAALAQDGELPPLVAAQALALVACCADGRLGADVPQLDDGLVNALPADGRVALLAAGALARAVCNKDEDSARNELSSALLMQEITDDTYLLVAVVDAGIRRGVLLVQDDFGTRLLDRAHILHGWLGRSAAGLGAARDALDGVRTQWSETLTLQAREMAGVSPAVFAAADAGDRSAMKDMVWNLKTREASPEALASALPWTHWLYRMMGAEGDGPMGDFCGVVDAAARGGRLKPVQAEALRMLFKRFIGPGEIEPEHVTAALQVFAGQAAELAAIRQLQLYDRITSQELDVPAAEIERARVEAAAAGASGLSAFLGLQLAGRALAAGNSAAARPNAEAALQAWLTLSAEDAAYVPRTNMCAAFLHNVAQASGNAAFQAQVLRDHRPRIEAYIAER